MLFQTEVLQLMNLWILWKEWKKFPCLRIWWNKLQKGRFPVEETVTPTESYGSFQVPQTVEEPSLDESIPLDVPRKHITFYEVVTSGSQRCGDMLVDNQGYSFTVKKRNVSSVSWRCKVRNKVCNCKATVIQKGSEFIPGPHSHNHQPAPGAAAKAKVTAALKEVTSHHKFLSGARCVNQVLQQAVTEDEVLDALPKHCNLVRTVNRHRERSCPKHPQSLDFEIATEHIPENFLRDDLSVHGKPSHICHR